VIHRGRLLPWVRMDLSESVRKSMHVLLEAGSSQADSVWTSLRGGRLHHLEAGSGPPVVLLHGGTGGGANWFRQIGPLSQRYRVLAPDLPGFGLSDPVSPAAPLGRAAAQVLLEWMSVHDVDDALVVGTSFGGLTAIRLAQSAPARRISRLLLLDSAGFGRRIHAAVRLAATAPLTPYAVRPTRPGTSYVLRWLLTSRSEALPSPMRETLVEFLYATGLRAGTWYLARTLRLFVGPRGQREVFTRKELAAIAQPVSVVWGGRDRLLPVAHAQRAGRSIPGATVRVLAGAGHSPNWEAPAEVVAAIDDLALRAPARLA
jgi:pimeloyl-ACP methyl ester carboxylesterase